MFVVTLCTSEVYRDRTLREPVTRVLVFTSASVLWAVGLCLKDVVGVRPLKAEGHFCFMFAQTCLYRPHCIQERWGSMWSLTCPEWITFRHPFHLSRAFVYGWDTFYRCSPHLLWQYGDMAWSSFSNMTHGQFSYELMVECNLHNPMSDLSFSKQILIIWACSSSTLVVSVKCERKVVMAKPNHRKFMITSTTDKSV